MIIQKLFTKTNAAVSIGILSMCFSIFALATNISPAQAAFTGDCQDMNAIKTPEALKTCLESNLISRSGANSKIAPYTRMSVEDQVKTWIVARGLDYCLRTADLKNGIADDYISESSIGNPDGWFNDELGTGTDVNFGSAFYGTTNMWCNAEESDEIKWISPALGTWGVDEGTGVPPKDFLCVIGFVQDDGQSDCTTGSSGLDDPNENGNLLVKWLKSDVYGNQAGALDSLTTVQEYYFNKIAFENGCFAQPSTNTTGTPNEYNLTLNVVDPVTGVSTPTLYNIQGDQSKDSSIRTFINFGNELSDTATCEQLASRANAASDTYSKWIVLANNPLVAGLIPTSGGGIGGVPPADECDIFGDSALRWVLCPALKAATAFTDGIQNIVGGLLEYDTQLLNDDSGIHKSWEVFRGFALTLLVISALIMVISQILGFNFLDAYTIKKVLPRLLIAIIGISLSWQIMGFVLTFFNDIGGWIGSIITNSFGVGAEAKGSSNLFFNGAFGGIALGGVATGIVTGTGATAGIVATSGAWGPILLSFVFVVAVMILIGLAVLGLRIAIIGAALVFAPIAIACYVLPGTKKIWDFWQNTFITALVMYPIVMGFIALGKGLAFMLAETNASVILIMLIYFAPFALLPVAFKLSGGLMKTIFSIADDKSKGVFDRGRKFRADHKAAGIQDDIDGKTNKTGIGGVRQQFRQRTDSARHGHSAWGADYRGARQSHLEDVTNETLKKAGSTGQNDEINSLVASGVDEHAFVDARAAMIYRSKTAAYRNTHGGNMSAAAATAIEQESLNAARVEGGRVHARYGGFQTNHAMDVATKAKLASASAYTNTNSDGSPDSEADYQELYGDITRMMARGSITSGDGIGLIKGYMANRPDMKGASAGLTSTSLEESAANLAEHGSPTLSRNTIGAIQESALRNMTSGQHLGSDARSARNNAPALLRAIVDRQRNYAADQGRLSQLTPGSAAYTQVQQEAAASHRELKKMVAVAGNIHDRINDASPEVAEHYTRMLSQTVGTRADGSAVSVLALSKSYDNDPESQAIRKVFNQDPAGTGQNGPAAPTPPPTPGTPGGTP